MKTYVQDESAQIDKKSAKAKRKRKVEQVESSDGQSKGIITSATMLSVVGLLNYMGNTAA